MKDTQMANEYLKKMFSIIIHYAQQTTMRHHYTPMSMSKMKNTDKSSTGKDVKKVDDSYSAGRNVKLQTHSTEKTDGFI